MHISPLFTVCCLQHLLDKGYDDEQQRDGLSLSLYHMQSDFLRYVTVDPLLIAMSDWLSWF